MAGSMDEFEAEFIEDVQDVTKINSKASTKRLEEYFIATLEKGAEVDNINNQSKALVEFVICSFPLFHSQLSNVHTIVWCQCGRSLHIKLFMTPFIDFGRRSRY